MHRNIEFRGNQKWIDELKEGLRYDEERVLADLEKVFAHSEIIAREIRKARALIGQGEK